MELRDNNCVKYIDVTSGSREAYIRCDTAEAAQAFMQKSNEEGKRLTILKGMNKSSLYTAINKFILLIFQAMKKSCTGIK